MSYFTIIMLDISEPHEVYHIVVEGKRTTDDQSQQYEPKSRMWESVNIHIVK